MKIKILILVFIMFMMCGCSASVDIEIKDKKVFESVDITAYQNVIYTKEILNSSFRNYIPVYARDLIVDTLPDTPREGIKYYEKTTTDLGNGYKFNYKYTFGLDEYSEARTIKDGFRYYDFSYNDTNNTITISTDDNGLLYFNDYDQLDEVRINIKTNYFVESNNADKVDGNTYTWVFNKDSKKSIEMTIDTDSDGVVSSNNLVLILSVAIVVAILVFLTLKSRDNNKI